MKLRYFLGALVLVVAFAAGASAQESEVSGGGGGGITAAPGSGTAGRVPQFASASSLADSKMTTSGTNSGTWTLYDNTAVTGVSQIYVRDGAGQASSPQLVLGTHGVGVGLSIYARPSTAYVDFRDGNAGSYINLVANGLYGGSGGWALEDSSNALVLSSGSKITWQSAANYYSGSPDIGLARSAAGILAVTDGSTGQGGIGLSDGATNTVSDALILRHNGGTVSAGAGFGTGLQFQGESTTTDNVEMGSIKAVWSDSTHATRDADLKLYGVVDGVSTLAFTVTPSLGGAGAALVGAGITRISTGAYIVLEGGADQNIYLGNTSEGFKWMMDGSDDSFRPYTTNTYDIGTSSAFVRNNYVSTSIQGTRTQAITDNAAAATFVTIAVPTSNTTVGGRIFYTITAIDAGTAIQTKTGTYSFGLNNIGGTVTGAGTDVLEHSQLSAGTLAPTFSVNISGTNAQFQLVLDTSLDAGAEVLKIEYRVQIDSGTATVTPAT